LIKKETKKSRTTAMPPALCPANATAPPGFFLSSKLIVTWLSSFFLANFLLTIGVAVLAPVKAK